jgi:peptidoglycan/LPS O-acetylase OafA/YrhL
LSDTTAAPLRHQNRALTSIRGVAALWVVGLHLQFGLSLLGYREGGAIFKPGYLAVDIFFILSGFVITAVHRDLATATDGMDFFIRRVFRIYPLHLFVLTLLLALWLWEVTQYGSHDPTEQLRDLPIVALLLQPYLIQGLTWNTVSWSIGVEMLCYLLFPLALRLLCPRPLPGTLLLLAVACLFERHAHSEMVWGWPAIQRGLAGFALGMVLQQASSLLPRPSGRAADLFGILALAGIVFALSTHAAQDVPLWAALLIFALAAERGRLSRALGAPPLYWLGQISFSLYLLHPTLASLAFALLPPAALHLGPHATPVVWSAILLAVLLGLATVTWALVEEPARRLGGRLARRARNQALAGHE